MNAWRRLGLRRITDLTVELCHRGYRLSGSVALEGPGLRTGTQVVAAGRFGTDRDVGTRGDGRLRTRGEGCVGRVVLVDHAGDRRDRDDAGAGDERRCGRRGQRVA